MNIRKNLKYGFTLIELIIVIAIIGILAAALLSALKPAEQINRAKDSGLQVAAKAEFDAINRFYAQQGYYPNCSAASGAAVCVDFAAGYATDHANWVGAGGVGAPTANTPESRLETTGELKTAFLVGVSAPASIVVSAAAGTAGPGNAMVVCFAPTSAAYLAQATFTSIGGTWSSGVKYMCLK